VARAGEPGATAGAAVVLVVMAPDHVWWMGLRVCVLAITISTGGRSLPRWMIP
jgi:hypothetical protein